VGFNLQAGPVSEVWEDEGGRLAEALVKVCPNLNAVDGEYFCINDEMGWSWWEQFQTFAKEKLGEVNTPAICSLEAWVGAYLPSRIQAQVIQLHSQKKGLLGLGKPKVELEFPVASLLDFWDELMALGAAAGLPTAPESAEELRRSYDEDDRYEEDPAIQCYCHAIVTAAHAIKTNQAMFTIK
jgi:hypothetical protein